jgi:integrase
LPRPIAPPRLWLKPASVGGPATWIIKFEGKRISTGLRAEQRSEAEKALHGYLGEKHRPATERSQSPESIHIADVMSVYLDAVKDRVADQVEFLRRFNALLDFWGMKMLADVNGATCRAYVAQSRSIASARRELEDLRSAINYHRREGFHDRIVSVTLPARATARERWLTRSEAARLVWAAWSFRQTRNGVLIDKFPRRHVARFILAALYSGSRSAAILDASFERLPGRGFVDLERGVWYRAAEGAVESNKRRPTIPIPTRLLWHMKRWRANGQRHLIEFDGQAVGSLYLGFMLAVKDAGLEDVSPHTLRHTAVSWAMQAGADSFTVGGFVGMTAATIQNVYGHVSPSGMARVGAILTRGGR